MKLCNLTITGSHYREWDEDECDTEDDSDEELFNYNQGPTMTKASEVLLLRDNEKSRLLENFLQKHFFREFVEVSLYVFL